MNSNKIKKLADLIDITADALMLKHGSHDQSAHGRGGSRKPGGGGAAGGGGKKPPKKPAAGGGGGTSEPPEHGLKEESEYPSFKGKPLNPKGYDTESLHMKPGSNTKGKSLDEIGKMYSPERQKLHAKIVDSFFEGKTPVDKPQSFMMGGGPASGKSTVVDQGFVKHPKNIVNVDSDAIKAQLPEYRAKIRASSKDGAAFAHEESSYLSKVVMAKSVKDKYNTNLDGTGDSGMDKLRKKVGQMRAAGAPVKADYMTMDTDLSWKIAEMRGGKTGRHVPETVVRNTHKTVSQVLPTAMKEGLFDKVTLWDNNVKGKPVKVASGAGKKMVIHDKKLWADFIKKGE
jgi:predicted ABC-type ATPase